MTYNPKGLAVIIQCRLSSTRLPGKAVKDLGGRTVLEWTLASMKKVNAEYYYVATDEESYDTLLPIVTKMGYQLFKGPLEDVLERYCLLIEKIGCKTVLRATADNPFLFYEAAELLCQEFEKKSKISKVDYMTMTGLPHGSGVEIFRADSLLLARTLTKDPFDHEHVGPSLYNHKNTFVSLFTKAPSRFYYPDLRTTIDTPQDYRRAVSVVKRLSDGVFPSEPYTTEEIVSAEKDKSVTDTVLFIPSIKKGQGTGHLRRCLKLANEINGFVYLSYLHNQESEGRVKDACQKEVLLKDAGGKENCGNAGWANTNTENFSESEIDEINSFVKDFMKKNPSFKEYQIVLSFPEENEYSLIVTDMFSCPKSFMELLKNRGKVLSIDEGSAFHEFSDYLLDIIPSEGLERDANFLEPKFMEGAKNKKKGKPSEIKNVLISFGGEDLGKWTEKTAEYFSKSGLDVSVILPAKRKEEIYQNLLMKELSDKGLIRLLEPYPELKESLYLYDLVLTHYGFTSYEALSANTHVILFPISRLHERLSKKYGFSLFDEKKLCQEYDKLYVESLLNLNYLKNSTDCEKKSPYEEKTADSSTVFSSYGLFFSQSVEF
ncbi:MAG: hypothetical protein K6E78_02245, partial [Treponema sp.]|nr:hypothetical protein [Treponema sp.]